MNWRTWGGLTLAAWLAACGGGGGGGGGGSPPADGGSPGTPEVEAPTFAFSPSDPVSADSRTSMLMAEVLQTSGNLLNYAQFTTDIAHRFANPKSPATVTANCAYVGHVTLQFDDRDGNGYASAGDVITATLENCGVPIFSRALSGTLRVEIQSTSPTADLGLQARMVVLNALQFSTWTGGPTVDAIPPGALRGSLGVKWTEGATGSQLQALSTTEDDLRYAATVEGAELTNPTRKIDISRSVRYDTASVNSSVSFMYDVAPRHGSGGSLRVKTSQPFMGDLDVISRQFSLDAAATSGLTLRATRGPAGWSSVLAATQLVQASGTASSPLTAGWSTSLSLMHDPRTSTAVLSYTDQGGGYRFIAPWRDSALMQEIDRICQQNTQAGVSRYQADALFQRPVALQASVTQAAGATVKIQFGREIAQAGQDLKFRLLDITQNINANEPSWDVPITVTRRGSSFEIQLGDVLRHGRSYGLVSSFDGTTWTGERYIVDPQGLGVNRGSEGFGGFATNTLLVADAYRSDMAVVSASQPARLRGTAATRDSQTVSSFHWEQLSGVPLKLATPDAAETDVTLTASGPQQAGDAVLQLTVTDSLGTTDRVRVRLLAGNFVAQGALLYTQGGSDLTAGPYAELGAGAGSLFYGASPGTVSPRLPAADAGGTGTSLSITPANGAQLAVGHYGNAIKSDAPGAQNGLVSRVFCNTVGSPTTGSFDVLDVAYAADGTITRLAVDFTQQCQLGWHEYQRGSYRYNSTVPISP